MLLGGSGARGEESNFRPVSFVTEAHLVFSVHKVEFVSSCVVSFCNDYRFHVFFYKKKPRLISMSKRSPNVHIQSSITVVLFLEILLSWQSYNQL